MHLSFVWEARVHLVASWRWRRFDEADSDVRSCRSARQHQLLALLKESRGFKHLVDICVVYQDLVGCEVFPCCQAVWGRICERNQYSGGDTNAAVADL